MRRICSPCCARAAIGQAVAPPRRMMNSRRRMCPRWLTKAIVSRQTSRLEGVGCEDSVCPLWVTSRHVHCNTACPLWANSGHCSTDRCRRITHGRLARITGREAALGRRILGWRLPLLLLHLLLTLLLLLLPLLHLR